MVLVCVLVPIFGWAEVSSKLGHKHVHFGIGVFDGFWVSF